MFPPVVGWSQPHHCPRSVDAYAFCPDCGTRLYHKNALRAGKVSLRAGTLDDTSGLNPEKHIWVKSKQPWVVLPEGVPMADEQT